MDCRRNASHLFKYGHEPTDPSGIRSAADLPNIAIWHAALRWCGCPTHLPDEVACPPNCATATVAAALRVAGDCRDRTVLVQGAGMLGCDGRCDGHGPMAPREVIVCDFDEEPSRLAAQFGATQAIPLSPRQRRIG